MGKSKTIFMNERNQQVHKVSKLFESVDTLFRDSNTITLDVRVRYQLDANVAENAPIKVIKDSIRKDMISKFRKELTKQLNDQIG